MRTLYILAGILAALATYEVVARLSSNRDPDLYDEARKMRVRQFGIQGEDL